MQGMADTDARRLIPRTDQLLTLPEVRSARARLGDEQVRNVVRGLQAQARRGALAPGNVEGALLAVLATRRASSLRAVLNATGVVVHTNLGRAPLSAAAVDALVAAAGYVDVELDLATGTRSRRGAAARAALLAACPAAEDALVVNNGAAALVLATTALAAGREVVVSRGELVEIGAGFRLPDLIASTGARLREVGTTNRTRRAGLRRRDRAGHRLPAQGAPQQLPGRGLHRGRSRLPSCAPWPRSTGSRWSPTSAADCWRPTRCSPTSRTRPPR